MKLNPRHSDKHFVLIYVYDHLMHTKLPLIQRHNPITPPTGETFYILTMLIRTASSAKSAIIIITIHQNMNCIS